MIFVAYRERDREQIPDDIEGKSSWANQSKRHTAGLSSINKGGSSQANLRPDLLDFQRVVAHHRVQSWRSRILVIFWERVVDSVHVEIDESRFSSIPFRKSTRRVVLRRSDRTIVVRKRENYSRIIEIIADTNNVKTVNSRVRRISSSTQLETASSAYRPGSRWSASRSSLRFVPPSSTRCPPNGASKTWVASSNLPRCDDGELMSVAIQLDHVAPDEPSRTFGYFLSSFWLPPAFSCRPRLNPPSAGSLTKDSFSPSRLSLSHRFQFLFIPHFLSCSSS